MARALEISKQTIENQLEEINNLRLENKEKQEQLEIQAPKVSYYDIVLHSPNLVTVT